MVIAVGTVTGLSTVSGGGNEYVPFPGGQSVFETAGPGNSTLASALRAGLDALSGNQTVTFTLYKKVILPFDGYVFWVKASLLSESALINDFALNTSAFNQPRRTVAPALSIQAKGSLHYASVNKQDPHESYTVNRMTFTSEQPVNDLNDIGPSTMYIATMGNFRFAFSEQQNFYRQADLYHYVGDAMYPVMEPLIIDDVADLDTRNVVVSNSMPIWLSLNKFMPMYPSYLAPENVRPPFCVVDIYPDSQRALQMAPLIDRQNNHWQLVTERVELTMHGLRNFNALDFMDYVFAQSLRDNTFGIMNSPVIRDEKRLQTELNVIAMKKSVEMEINYYQVTVRNIARQLILDVIPSFYVGGGVSAVPS